MRTLVTVSMSTGFLLAAELAIAQINLDGSLGARVPLVGPDIRIGAELGTTRGGNLFHSFSDFNLRAGERATFTGPTGLANVIARVTGGGASFIDGGLRSEVAGANLFFINPAGVVFGPNSALRVDGSFHVSTADYLRFADGNRFDARSTSNTVLSAAPPAAFGFLTDRPADISFLGARARIASLATDVGLQAGDGADLTVTGGNLIFGNGRAADGALGGAWLRNLGGKMALTSVASQGEVALPGSASPDTVLRAGAIAMSGDTYIEQFEGGGVAIRAGRFEMSERAAIVVGTQIRANAGAVSIAAQEVSIRDAARVSSDALGSVAGAAIEFRVRDGIDIVGVRDPQVGSALVISTASADGPGGQLRFDTGRLSLSGTGAIVAQNASNGTSASIQIRAGDSLTLSGNARITGTVGVGASGDSGAIDLAARTIELRDESFVSNLSQGAGRGGALTLNGGEQIRLADRSLLLGGAVATGAAGTISLSAPRIALPGGRVEASTFSNQSGGDITIGASESLIVTASGSIVTSTVADGATGRIRLAAPLIVLDSALVSASSFAADAIGSNRGRAGDISVEAGTLNILNGTRISTLTGSAGDAGKITIRAVDLALTGAGTTIVADSAGAGVGGTIDLSATQRMQISQGASVSAGALGTGTGGSVALRSGGQLEILDSASILTNTAGLANAGKVVIAAPTIVLANIQINSTSDANSDGSAGPGRAGTISVDAAGSLRTSNTRLYTVSRSRGDAGGIVMSAQDIAISGGLISAQTFSTASAGAIVITARNNLSLSGAAVTSRTDGAGSGGTVALDGARIDLANGAVVEARSFGSGDAGNISVIATDGVRLRNSTIATQALLANGGNIVIKTPSIVYLAGSDVTASVGGAGKGGNIFIDPRFVVLRGGSQVTATAVTGDGGNIAIKITDGGAFIPDPDSVVSASSQFGVDGTVRIEGPARDIASGLRALSTSYLDAAGLSRTPCAARKAARSGSFVVVTRRDGPAAIGGAPASTIFDLREGSLNEGSANGNTGDGRVPIATQPTQDDWRSANARLVDISNSKFASAGDCGY